MDANRGRFLNVDLDLVSRKEPVTLLKALEDKSFSLYSERTDWRRPPHHKRVWVATFELRKQEESPDEAVQGFHRIVRGLRGTARKEWQACLVRQLSIGFDRSAHELAFMTWLSSESVALAGKMGCSIEIVAYPPTDG